MIHQAANDNNKKYSFKSSLPKWQITLTFILLIFGVLLTAQFYTHIAVSNSLEMQNAEDLSMIILNLNQNRDSLLNELITIRHEYDSIEEKAHSGISLSATLDNQIKQLQVFSGAVAVYGPGVSISITGDSNIIYLDIIDLINELYATGAEAVSINDHRIQYNTIIKEAYNNNGVLIMTVDGQELLSPIVVKAIGDPETLEKGLTFTGGIIDLFNIRFQVYPIVKKEEKIIIQPAPNKPMEHIKKSTVLLPPIKTQ
ncbi:MAG: DUF881 domain-containing protein [Clostridiales bacterium]